MRLRDPKGVESMNSTSRTEITHIPCQRLGCHVKVPLPSQSIAAVLIPVSWELSRQMWLVDCRSLPHRTVAIYIGYYSLTDPGRDGKLSRPWCTVAAAGIRTRDHAIASPASSSVRPLVHLKLSGSKQLQ